MAEMRSMIGGRGRVARTLGLLVWGLGLGFAAGCTDDSTGGRVAAGARDAGAVRPDLRVEADAAVAEDAAPPRDTDPAPQDAAPLQDAAPDVAVPVDAAWVDPPTAIISLDTRLGLPSTTAGLSNRVTCEALDPEGVPVSGIVTRVELRPALGWRVAAEGEGMGLGYVGERAGAYAVTCVADALGLRDPSPARWDVFAGPAVTVLAEVDTPIVHVDSQVIVTCAAFDAEGNPVAAGDATLRVSPDGPGAQADGTRLTFTEAGRFLVACELPGVGAGNAVEVQVLPDPPSSIALDVLPVRAVYGVDEVVTLAVLVTDRFGNRLPDAPLVFSAEPPLPGFGDGRYRLAAPGVYQVRVCVDAPELEPPLCAERTLVVDEGGPAVRCTTPTLGEIRGVGPVRVQGEVADVVGVARLQVDGDDVVVDPSGRFEVEVPGTWGLNVVDLVATDAQGNETSTFCAWFAADAWAPEDRPLNDALQLVLRQRAVDDGEPPRPISSLADLLRNVLGSQALVDTIDQALRAQNPVLPNECRQRVLGLCVLSLGAEYRGLRVRGPNTVSLTLVNDGLRVQGRINRVELDVRLLGTLGNTGTLTADYIALDLTFGLGLANGRPQVNIRSIDAVGVGSLQSDFDGFLTGALLDLVFSAFEGTVRTTVADALRGFLESEVDALLTGVLSGLDVTAFDAAVDLPALGGGDPIALELGFGFSTVTSNVARLVLGVATSVSGPAVEATPLPGVPLPPGPVAFEVPGQGSAAASVSLGLVNQLLVAAWRGGLFRVADGGALLGGLGDGAELELSVSLPPAAIGTGDGATLRLFLGPASVRLRLPGVFDEPLRLTLAASATAEVALEAGNRLVFGAGQGIVVERLSLAAEGLQLSGEGRATLERLMTRVVQSLLDTSLNGALPTLPIPDFALPEDLVRYGVPAGTRIGLRRLSLSGTDSHWTADGEFGE
jgi:hypothetical protein